MPSGPPRVFQPTAVDVFSKQYFAKAIPPNTKNTIMLFLMNNYFYAVAS
jgi:hypothetical protein